MKENRFQMVLLVAAVACMIAYFAADVAQTAHAALLVLRDLRQQTLDLVRAEAAQAKDGGE